MRVNAKSEFVTEIDGKDLKCAYIEIWEENVFRELVLKEDYSPYEFLAFLKELDFEYNNEGKQFIFGTIWYANGSWSERGNWAGLTEWIYRSKPHIPIVCAKEEITRTLNKCKSSTSVAGAKREVESMHCRKCGKELGTGVADGMCTACRDNVVAFDQEEYRTFTEDNERFNWMDIYLSGMPLRVWFAGQALSGGLAGSTDYTTKTAVAEAYRIADAMMKVRKE